MWPKTEKPIRTGVPWGIFVAHGAAWLIAAAFGAYVEWKSGVAIAILGVLSLAVFWIGFRITETRRWIQPLQTLVASARRVGENPEADLEGLESSRFVEVATALRELQGRLREANRKGKGAAATARPAANDTASQELLILARSGIRFAPVESKVVDHPTPGAGPDEIVCRLDPRTLRWLSSSSAEQTMLGAGFDVLQRRSYANAIHPEDRAAALTRIKAAMDAGEAHGLRWRVLDASGKPRSLSVSLYVRYDPDAKPLYVKLHSIDETDKVRANQKRLVRERRLASLNQQLSLINADLRELTETNAELYENAPVMYFSLDRDLNFLDCNRTMLASLGLEKPRLIGTNYASILPDRLRNDALKLAEAHRQRSHLEFETCWRRPDGKELNVWFATTRVTRRDGSFDYTRCVARDETERRRLQTELREANEELKATIEELSRKNKELDEFTHVVSHDLLEPVRSLISFSQFLQADFGTKLDGEAREYLGHIVDAAKRQRSLIHDLLHLSKAGRVTSEFRPIDLQELLASIRTDLSGLIRDRRARLEFAATVSTLPGDRGRLVQLLSNLIVNGIKYNKSETPTVSVTAEPADNGFVSILVRDNGIGIPETGRARAFELFRQLHPRGEYEGTGAGLAICRKIAQAHGGSIEILASAEGEGGGTVFEIRLPLGGESNDAA